MGRSYKTDRTNTKQFKSKHDSAVPYKRPSKADYTLYDNDEYDRF